MSIDLTIDLITGVILGIMTVLPDGILATVIITDSIQWGQTYTLNFENGTRDFQFVLQLINE